MSEWDKLPVVTADKTAAAPADKTSAPAAPADKKPWDSLPPVAPAAAATPTPDKPRTIMGDAVSSAANIPKDIWKDAKAGLSTIQKSLQHHDSLLSGPQAALGAAEVIGSPATGFAKAAVDAIPESLLPKNTMFGKVARDTLEDAIAMFGPGEAAKLGKAITSSSGPVRELMDAGVQLTLGQLDPKIAKRMEEAAKSVPILGSFIRAAEARTLDSFNVATVRKQVAPLGDIGDVKNGREAMTKAHDMADARYEQIRQNVPSLQLDKRMEIETNALHMELGEGDPTIKTRVDNFIKNRLEHKWDSMTQAMTGADFKSAESELTKQIAENRYGNEQGREYARRLSQIRDILRGGVERQYPKVAEALKEVNGVYARLADIDYAQAARTNAQGRFTPGDLLKGIKRQDRSPRHMQFNEGNRPMQKWAEQADDVIGNKMPDSGTAERAMYDIGGAGGLHYLDPTGTALWGIGAGSALYSAPGQRATNAVVKAAPDYARSITSILGKSGPAAAVANIAEQDK